MTSPSTVLILVRDVLGAGLLGALVEGIGKEPLFPFVGERAETAVARLRPALVLLDCHHPAARSNPFFAAAETAASRIVLFAPATPWEDVEEIARRPQVTAFVHPKPGESLAELLREALAT
jgi:hypothetical protein